MTQRPKIPYRAKMIYVRSRPELWERALDLTREMMRLGFWSPTTSVSDCYRSVKRLVAKVQASPAMHAMTREGGGRE